MSKHLIKGWIRGAYGRIVWHSGLWRLFDRCMGRRLVILAGHCVGDGAGLPADMTLSPTRFRKISAALSKRFEWATVGSGVAQLQAGGRGPSLAAWTFDDGYRNNHDVLMPLLEETGARASVFLEGRPLLEKKVSWSHQFFWLIHVAGLTPGAIAQKLIETGDEGLAPGMLQQASRETERAEYLIKRVLKYDCDAGRRNAALRALFEAQGGDESALCADLYVDAEMAQRMGAFGIEMGGHTHSHEVLSTLPAADAAREIALGRESVERVLGSQESSSFAYPYGRRWDFRPSEEQALAGAGYKVAVTTHPGVYQGRGNTLALGRVMVEESTPIHHILCEACGAYQWLRKLGVELAE